MWPAGARHTRPSNSLTVSAIVPLATSHVSPVVVASTPGVSDPSDKNCAQRSYYLYDCRAVVPLWSSAAGRLGGMEGKREGETLTFRLAVWTSLRSLTNDSHCSCARTQSLTHRHAALEAAWGGVEGGSFQTFFTWCIGDLSRRSNATQKHLYRHEGGVDGCWGV